MTIQLLVIIFLFYFQEATSCGPENWMKWQSWKNILVRNPPKIVSISTPVPQNKIDQKPKPKPKRPEPPPSPVETASAETSHLKTPQEEEKPAIDIDKFREETLVLHNKKRALHKDPDDSDNHELQINEKLNELARRRASDKINFTESNSILLKCLDCGVNEVTMKVPITAESVFDTWYNEKQHYNYEAPDLKDDDNTQHFTQIVWLGSKEFGIDLATLDGENYWIVAVYKPRGNFPRIGKIASKMYKKNVKPPLS